MKRYKESHLALVAAAVLLTLMSAACSGASVAPEIAVAPVSHDFGQVGLEPVTTTFTVRNEGDGPLRIESVSTSCGCTTAEMSAQTIPPGELAKLTVTFDPQAHAGALGQFVRFVYLRTNDPTTPEVEVQISAEVTENLLSEEALQ